MKTFCAIFTAAVVAAISSTAMAGHRGSCHSHSHSHGYSGSRCYTGYRSYGHYDRCYGGSRFYVGAGYGSWWYPSYYRPAYYSYPYYYAPYGHSYYRGSAIYGHQTRSVASDVQLALARRGYYDGRIDGIIGPQSRRAIRDYQAAQGLPVTGSVDAYLLRSLRLS